MSFNSKAVIWATLENATELDENDLYDGYCPQLSVFVTDSANPKSKKIVSTALTEIVDLANASVTLSSHDGRIEVTQDDDTHYITGDFVCINGTYSDSNTITIDISLQNNGQIILKNVRISVFKSGMKVSEGANVELVLCSKG